MGSGEGVAMVVRNPLPSHFSFLAEGREQVARWGLSDGLQPKGTAGITAQRLPNSNKYSLPSAKNEKGEGSGEGQP